MADTATHRLQPPRQYDTIGTPAFLAIELVA